MGNRTSTAVSKCTGTARAFDGSGCICDLVAHARTHGDASDWKIARLVGAATYAQLLDSAPGLFVPFPDFRTDGNTASSLRRVWDPEFTHVDLARGIRAAAASGDLDPEAVAQPPPNLVSVIFAEGEISPADAKRLLINASNGHTPDPRIAPLIGSSRSYRSPELTLGQIVVVFVAATVLVSLIASVGLRIFAHRRQQARAG